MRSSKNCTMAVSGCLFHTPSQGLEEPSWLSYYYSMRGAVLLVLAVLSLVSCSIPVLKSDLLEKGVRDVSMAQLTESPRVYEGKLFILGGIIVSTRLTEIGSLIEAIYIPVSSAGYLKEMQPTTGRYLAFYPKELGVLDPVVYRTGKLVTLAGEFAGLRPERIDEMEYTFPYFVIRQIYSWAEGQDTRGFPASLFSTGLGVGRW